ncbi:MAG: class I SAM-dependent methyltransferase [Chitinophagaceae bacterium]|uniref:class I SAM-dependent methyltransferase n=1 Tax=unclassified Paraflavitalea TaxID=2798305 RepID=UPI003D350AD8|nr:class I SAM-dependent methyltransferase [Chitinophagaceae bacterium]
MNDLELYFRNNDKRLIHKWAHYFEIYERHFAKYRNKPITILEIGVFQGGSLQMWKSYFGHSAQIFGVDIEPRCKEFEEDNIQIFIGSQSDPQFLESLKTKIPKVDILIDDGGHTMLQQITTFNHLFEHIKDDGVYLIEDLHTSYWIDYGGGHKRPGTFIEFSKQFIDQLNAFHSQENSLKVTKFSENVSSIHYYDSVMVIEKKKKLPLKSEATGTAKYTFNVIKLNRKEKIKRKIELILRYLGIKSILYP